MKRNTRKGFTGIELVIVIAIIAILATALIPAFGGLFDSANKTADKQLAKNLNTALLLHNINSEADNFSDVLDAARAEGYLISNMNPTAKGCYLVWESQSNQFLLVDAEEGFEVLFAADPNYPAMGETWHFATADKEAVADLKAMDLKGAKIMNMITSLSDLATAVGQGGTETYYIDESLVIDVTNTVKLNNEEAKVTIDLGSNVVTGGSDDTSARAFPFYLIDGEMNLKNGVIRAISAFIDADNETRYNAVNAEGGVLNIEGTTIELEEGTIVVSYSGATGTLKNVTINADDPNSVNHNMTMIGAYAGSNVRVENCVINADQAAVYSSSSGGAGTVITIDGGNYHTNKALIDAHGGEVVIEDGIFDCDMETSVFVMRNVSGSKFIIMGGTFNGVKFENLDEATLRGMTYLVNLTADKVSITEEAIDGKDAWVISLAE